MIVDNTIKVSIELRILHTFGFGSIKLLVVKLFHYIINFLFSSRELLLTVEKMGENISKAKMFD